MEDEKKQYYVILPGYTQGEYWSQDKLDRNKEKLLKDHPDVSITETSAYSQDQQDIDSTDAVRVTLPETGQSQIWDAEKFNRNRNRLYSDHPEVKVERHKPVNIWEQVDITDVAPEKAPEPETPEADTDQEDVDYANGMYRKYALESRIKALEDRIERTRDNKLLDRSDRKKAVADLEAELEKVQSNYDTFNEEFIKTPGYKRHYDENIAEAARLAADAEARQWGYQGAGSAKYKGEDVQVLRAGTPDSRKVMIMTSGGDKKLVKPEELSDIVNPAVREGIPSLNDAVATDAALLLRRLALTERQKPLKGTENSTLKNFFKSAGAKIGNLNPGDADVKKEPQALMAMRPVLEKLENYKDELEGNPELKLSELKDEKGNAVFSDAEEQLYESYMDLMAARAEREKDTASGVQGADIAVESVPFVLEMVLSRDVQNVIGEATGRAIAKGIARRMENAAIKRGRALMAKGFSKGVTGALLGAEKMAMRYGGSVAKRLASIAPIVPFMPTTQDAIAREAVQYDDEGNLVSMGTAIAKGLSRNFQEYETELFGEFVKPAARIFLRDTGANRFFRRMLGANVGRWARKATGLMTTSQFAARTAFDGILEPLEELKGALIDEYIRGEKGTLKDFFDKDNLTEMLIGFGPMSVLGLGTGVAGEVNRHRYLNDLLDVEKRFFGSLGELNMSDEARRRWADDMRSKTRSIDEVQNDVGQMLDMYERSLGDTRLSDEDKKEKLEVANEYAQKLVNYYAQVGVAQAMRDQERERTINEYRQTLGDHDFWQESEDGRSRTVTTADLNGERVYVTSPYRNAQGEIATGSTVTILHQDGRTGFASGADLRNINESSIDEFADGRLADERKASEQQRMQNEYRNKMNAIRQQLPLGARLSFGTEDAKREAVVVGVEPDGVVVDFGERVMHNGEEKQIHKVSFEEAGKALPTPIDLHVKTDDEMYREEADRLDAAKRKKRALNSKFRRKDFMMNGRRYSFERIYESPTLDRNGEEVATVVAIDEFGQKQHVTVRVSELENQEPIERESSKNNTMDTPDEEQQNISNEPKDFRGNPLPMTTNRFGQQVVDENELWNRDPEAWCRYNDQKANRAESSASYLAKAINKLAKDRDALNSKIADELDHSVISDLVDQRTAIEDRMKALQGLLAGYVQQAAQEAQEQNAAGDLANTEDFTTFEQRWRKAKTNEEKAQVAAEYVDSIKSEDNLSVMFVSEQNVLDILKNKLNAPKSIIKAVEVRIQSAKKNNLKVSGFTWKGIDFLFIENADSLEDIRVSYTHERQHRLNKDNGSLVEEIQKSAPAQELRILVERLSGGHEYDGEEHNILADEFSAFAMELAWKYDNFEEILKAIGTKEELIKIISEEYGRQRTSQSLSLAGNRRRGNANVVSYQRRTGRFNGPNEVRRSGEVERSGSGSIRRRVGDIIPEGTGEQPAAGEVEPPQDAESAAEAATVSEQGVLAANGFEVKDGDIRFAVRDIPPKEMWNSIVSAIAAETGVSKTKAKRWLNSETSLASIILSEDNAEYLDIPEDERYIAIKEDSDYPQGTVDFNNICRKRVAFTNIWERLQHMYPNHIFTGSDLADIRQIMMDHGLQVACGLCYVEDRRQLLGEIAQSFIDGIKDNFSAYAGQVDAKGKTSATKERNARKFLELIGDDRKEDLSIDDLLTREGSTRLSKEHPGIYAAFNAFNNARGQQAGNLFQGYAAYHREILNWTDAKVKKVNNNGGLRIFSYSDFEAHHLIDIIQIIQDCARRGIKIQGYTKVPAFARAVANTGVKLNRSLIPLGDTGIVDGKLAYDMVEGIDINDPDFLPSNNNVGNILIGINDEQIRLAMEDPFIDFIIPYHSNQSKLLRQKKQTGAWTNYKNFQTEKGGAPINIYTDVLSAAEAEGKPIKNERQFVKKFLAVCKERGLTPRFSQFLDVKRGEYVYTPGYYKFLVDFKMFDQDGNILPQEVVRPEFDDAFNEKILRDYAKGEKEKSDEIYDIISQEVVHKLGLQPLTDAQKAALALIGEAPAEQEESVLARTVVPEEELVATVNGGQKQAGGQYMTDADLDEAAPNWRTVYHGSGAVFDRFDFSHIGEGEGNQSFGWGGYVTEVENIGKAYAAKLGGQFYTIEIPDDNGQNYISYDEPLTFAQKRKIKEALIRELTKPGASYEGVEAELRRELGPLFRGDIYGSDVQGTISDYIGARWTDNGRDMSKAAKMLSDLGIVGMKYPTDTASDREWDGTYNYVMFNEDDLAIVDRLSQDDLVSFRISKRNSETIGRWLDKYNQQHRGAEADNEAADIFARQLKEAVLQQVDGIEDPITQLCFAKWFCQGTIRLGEEDVPKVEQAVEVARRHKVDPLQYKSPMDIIDAYGEIKAKEKPIDPDTVSTLHRAKELPGTGIVIYNVDESEESRENMRRIINTHFGPEASPWCLLQGDGKGNLTKDSKQYWEHYNAYPKQVAFQNGKLVAFSANSNSNVAWWDRKDRNYDGVPVFGKIKGDVRGTVVYDQETGRVLRTTGLYKGNKENGEYIEWSDLGNITERSHWKNGVLDGELERSSAYGVLFERSHWKNGEKDGLREIFYTVTGQKHGEEQWKNGRMLDSRTFYSDGNLSEERHYTDEAKGPVVAETKSYFKDGKLRDHSIKDYRTGFIGSEGFMRDGKRSYVEISTPAATVIRHTFGDVAYYMEFFHTGAGNNRKEQYRATDAVINDLIRQAGQKFTDALDATQFDAAEGWNSKRRHLLMALTSGAKVIPQLSEAGVESLDEAHEKAKNGPMFRIAPNGNPSNLTPEQYDMVRTPEFKAWFGDWENDPENASKVVDENGEPKVMYHGSAWKPLEENMGKAVFKMRNGMLGKGAYFTDNLAEAVEYADEHLDALPKDLHGKERIEFLEDEYVTDYFLNVRDNRDIVMKDGSMIVIARTPSQIKSATGNNGQFDANNPDIRFRVDTTVETMAERTYRENGAFSFTGKDRIENAADVAYIFRQLENAAVENSFVVFVKDGRPTILHTGIGQINSTTIDLTSVIAGYSDFKPDEVFMVHNHPSGNLYASQADKRILDDIQVMMPSVPVTGIIIDTVSGKFGLFDTGASTSMTMPEAQDEYPVEVLSFDRMVFRPEYRSELSSRKITGPDGIAAFLSAHRLGEGQKLGALLLNNNMVINGNLVTNDNELTSRNAGEMAAAIADAAVRCGANGVVLFGNFNFDTAAIRALKDSLEQMSGKSVSLLDGVQIEGEDVYSISDGTLRGMRDGVRFRTYYGGNSGYVGYSKSKRAVDAESRGLRSASQMNRAFADEVNALLDEGAERLTLKQIKEALGNIRPDEWHHTSKYGNRTNYYSAQTIADYFQNAGADTVAVPEANRTEEDAGYVNTPHEAVDTEIGPRNVYRASNGLLVEHIENNNLDPAKQRVVRPETKKLFFDRWDAMDFEFVDEFDKAVNEYLGVRSAAAGESGNIPDNLFRISAEQDEEYRRAYEEGDTEKASEMVDAAAIAAGYNTKAYHGTEKGFNIFYYDPRTGGNFFTPQIDAARAYAKARAFGEEGVVMPVYLDLGKTFEIDARGADWNEVTIKWEVDCPADDYNEVFETYAEAEAEALKHPGAVISSAGINDTKDIAERTRGKGYDSAIIRNVYDIADESYKSMQDDLIIFTPSRIKSAEPFTFDDNGELIPLSERFNPENDDIRFRFVGMNGLRRRGDNEAIRNAYVASSMERQGKDAGTIKMATGWEKGTDGKWRYEEPDFQMKDIQLLTASGMYLKDLINDEALFEAYPDLRYTRVWLWKKAPAGAAASYSPTTNEMIIARSVLGKKSSIVLKDGDPRATQGAGTYAAYKMTNDGRKSILHEIQHAIQHREGFARGGASRNMTDELPADIRQQVDAEYENYMTLEQAKDATPEYERWIASDVEDMFGKAYDDLTKTGEYKEYSAAFGSFLRNWGFTPREYSEAESKDDLIKANARRINYRRLAGEVESRNVEARADMTAEQRRQSLASETADIAAADQIVKFRLATPEEAAVFEAAPKVYRYKTVQIIDGLYYPPMDAVDPMTGELKEGRRFGDIEVAEEDLSRARRAVGKDGKPAFYKDGRPKYVVDLKKGTRGANGAKLSDAQGVAYNPYGHSSNTMFNDQFATAWNRDNLAVVRVELSKDDIKEGYRAEGAKDPVGDIAWKNGEVSNQLAKAGKEPRLVTLSRFTKVIGQVPWEEVADHYAEMLSGTDIVLPFNTVVPQLRDLLADRGVQIGEPAKGNAGDAARPAYEEWLNEREENVLDSPAMSFNASIANSLYLEGVEAGVADNGLASQIGAREYDNLMMRVYGNAPESERMNIIDRAMEGGYDFERATSERLAEIIRSENPTEMERELLDAAIAGVNDAIGDVPVNDAKWMLYLDATRGGGIIEEAGRAIVAYRLGFDTASQEMKRSLEEDVMFRAAGNAAARSAADIYATGLNVGAAIKEAHSDMYISVEKMMKAIEQVSGKDAATYENILLALNQLSSINFAEKDMYKREFLDPMWDVILSMMRAPYRYEGWSRQDRLEDIVRYVMLKHGLERNVVFAKRDAKDAYRSQYQARLTAIDNDQTMDDATKDTERQKAEAEYNAHVADVDNETDSIYLENRKKDYSGLMAQFYTEDKTIRREKGESRQSFLSRKLASRKPTYSDLADAEAEAWFKTQEFESKMTVRSGEVKEYNRKKGVVKLKEGQDHRLTDMLWEKVNAATKETLRHQLASGMINKSSYDALVNMFEYYVPLRGFKDATAEDLYSYMNSDGDAGFTAPVLTAKGRTTMADNPFGVIGAMAESAIQADNKNLAKQKLYYFIANRPDNGLAELSECWFEDSGQKDANGRKIWLKHYPNLRPGMTQDEITQAWEDLKNDMLAKRAMGIAVHKGTNRIDLQNSVIRIDEKSIPEHMIRVKVNGKDYDILVNGSPRAAQAVNGALNGEVTDNWFKRFLMGWNRLMSALATSVNPNFVVSNLLRDLQYAQVSAMGDNGAKFTAKFEKNLVRVMRGARIFRLVAMANGGKGLNIRKMNPALASAYEEFVANGGPTGYTYLTNNKEYDKKMEQYLRTQTSPEFIRQLRRFKERFDDTMEAVEQISRFAAYLTAKEMGMSTVEAVNAAKEITLNFNRKGSGKMIGWEEAGQFAQSDNPVINALQRIIITGVSAPAASKVVVMFYNAAVQALSKYVTLFKKAPVWMASVCAGHMTLGALNALLHSIWGGGDDDDEDAIDDYFNIPDYIRRNNFCIGTKNPHKYIRIPISQELAPFYALGDILVTEVFKKTRIKPNGRPISEAATAFGDLLPFNIVEPFTNKEGFGHGVVDMVMRGVAAASTPYSLYTNRTFYGADIHRENKFANADVERQKAHWTEKREKTAPFYQYIAKGLNWATGGDEVRGGFINPYPDDIKFVMNDLMGGAGKFWMQTINFVRNVVKGEESLTDDIPFISRVTTDTMEKNQDSYYRDAYNWIVRESFEIMEENEKAYLDAYIAKDPAYAKQIEDLEMQIKSLGRTKAEQAKKKTLGLALSKLQNIPVEEYIPKDMLESPEYKAWRHFKNYVKNDKYETDDMASITKTLKKTHDPEKQQLLKERKWQIQKRFVEEYNDVFFGRDE